MDKLETRALSMVLAGQVEVESVTFDDDGRIDNAVGFVKSQSSKQTWLVHISGNETTCNCPYGIARRDAADHTHAIALRLAAQRNFQLGGTK